MAIEVRCGCGQLVYAGEVHAGQHVRCPHCKAAVAVPVATAAATPPAPPAPPTPAQMRAEGLLLAGLSGLGLYLLNNYFEGLKPGTVKFLSIAALGGIIGGLSMACGGKGNFPVR
jgi:predicted lipid-binding transport protein (Tim44 family)